MVDGVLQKETKLTSDMRFKVTLSPDSFPKIEINLYFLKREVMSDLSRSVN